MGANFIPSLPQPEAGAPLAQRDPQARRGFAIIIGVIVVSGLALIASLTAALMFLGESHEMGDRAFSVQARAAAFSCADIAMLRLRQNRAYAGGENVSVDRVSCAISPVAASGDARTVYAQASVNGLMSRVRTQIDDVNEFFLSSWTEVAPQ